MENQNAKLEMSLQEAGQTMVSNAKQMSITSQTEYDEAGKVLVEIKTRVKQVKDYWKEPKAAADAAHKAVVNREKAMLAPLSEAETLIKKAMVVYQNAVEAARRKAEEEARQRQKEEAERLLAQAVKAEQEGDAVGSMTNLAMAEMVSDMVAPAAFSAPKTDGVSVRKMWKARVVDPKAVPAYYAGIQIRDVNQAVLNTIAKNSEGSATIPGVEFYVDSTITARSH